MLERIAFIGTGRMGGPMAARLVGAGHAVSVYDPDAAAVTAHSRHRARARRLPPRMPSVDRRSRDGQPALASRWCARWQSRLLLRPVSQCSSIWGHRVRPLRRLLLRTLAPAGIAAVDAPVSGGVKGAAAGTLTLMMSGPAAAAARVKPLLEVFGKVIVVGEKPGLGQTLKLANNLMSAASLAIASEAMAMGVKAGLILP